MATVYLTPGGLRLAEKNIRQGGRRQSFLGLKRQSGAIASLVANSTLSGQINTAALLFTPALIPSSRTLTRGAFHWAIYV